MIRDNQFLNAAWAIQHKAGDRWHKCIETTFKGKPGDDSRVKQAVQHKYKAVKGMPFASVVTANYDDFLVEALGTSAITHEDANEIAAMPRSYQLLKLHGSDQAEDADSYHGKCPCVDFFAMRQCVSVLLAKSVPSVLAAQD